MKITIIYDNESRRADCKADWGFSCLVQAHGRNILFDTGESGIILLNNMKSLEIDPLTIDEVFISHSHFDHSGGLSAFLDVNSHVRVYAPLALSGIFRAKEVEYFGESRQLHEHIWSTGLLNDIEQSLVVEAGGGLVLIAGCSHPGVGTILAAAGQFGKPQALIGGLHGFREFDLLQDLKLVCPTHCTQYKSEVKSRCPDRYIEGGVGTVIEWP
jgi:7,8-dihydropterin-6-yl-methyl-4-(beta-D-ribofuranosyl)aminobenzene 5'-phosphate synthase